MSLLAMWFVLWLALTIPAVFVAVATEDWWRR